jgi:hypothetical protein
LSGPKEPDSLENLMSGVDILFILDPSKFYRKQWCGYILLYEPKHQCLNSTLEREAGVKFEHILLLNLLILFYQLVQMQLKLSLTFLTCQIILPCTSFICALLKYVILLFFSEGDRLFLNLKFSVLDYLLCLQCGTSFLEASKRCSI